VLQQDWLGFVISSFHWHLQWILVVVTGIRSCYALGPYFAMPDAMQSGRSCLGRLYLRRGQGRCEQLLPQKHTPDSGLQYVAP
jgi:hypothetical protein